MRVNLTEVRRMIRRELALELIKEAVKKTVLLEQGKPSYEQNVEYLRRYKQGDSSALNDLVMANQGLIRKIAHSFASKTGIPFEDLEQAGYEGLLRALNKLEVDDDASTIQRKISSWARSQMQAQINQTRPVHIGGRDERTIMNSFTRTYKKLKAELGREPTDEEVAERLGVSVDKLKDVRNVGGISTETPVGEEGESQFGDSLQYQNQANPEDVLMQKEFIGFLDRFEKSLTKLQDKFAVKVIKGEMTGQEAADKYSEASGKDYGRAAMSLRAKQIKDKLVSYLGDEAVDYLEFLERNVAA